MTRRRRGRRVAIASAAVVVLLAIAVLSSPWPGSRAIRALFAHGAQQSVAEMQPYAPTADELTTWYDVGEGNDLAIDVFRPAGVDEALPLVVWVHGGAWISGDKADVRPYVQMIAAEGFVTAAIDYSTAPEHRYPRSIEDIHDALGWLLDRAESYGIDADRVVLAGDSAGANLVSQVATITTSSSYATSVGVEPALDVDQLVGVILDCGIYDVSGIPDAPGITGWGFRTALWAYLGERDWSATAGADQMSTMDHVTGDFPTTWISGGNGDPLTASQSQPFAERLESLGVEVHGVFYAADHDPSLPHEYQFHLDGDDARAAFDSTVEFLTSVTG